MRGSKVTPPPAAAKEAAKPAEAAPVEPPKPEKPKADEWAKLTHAEKKARKEREALDAERKAFAEERKGLEAQKERLSLMDRAKAGDWEAQQQLMREGGLTYDQLTKRMLAAGKVDKGETALERVERLEKELADRDAKEAERQKTQSFAATVDTFAMHVTKESPEAYPILAGEIESNRPWVESVLRALLDESASSGKTLTYAEAASSFETHLRTETERRAARLRPPPPPATEPEAPKPRDESRPRDETGRFAGGDGPRRLTNRDSAERASVPSPEPPSRRLTQRERDERERERIRRAAAAMPRRS